MTEKDVTNLIDKGNEFRDADNFEEAINCYANAAQIDPENADIYRNWCETISYLVGTSQYESLIENACKKFRNAVPVDTENADIIHYWGNVLGDLGFTKQNESLIYKACEKYAKAHQINSNNPDILNSWGCTLADLGFIRQDELLMLKACEKYEKAMQLDRKNTLISSYWAYILSYLYNIELDGSLLLNAFEKYDEIMQPGSNDADFFYNWGLTLFERGRTEQDEQSLHTACEKFDKATQPNSERVDILCSWGNALLNLYTLKQDNSLLADATEKFEKAKKLDPKNASNIYCYWGHALSKLFTNNHEVSLLEKAREKYSRAAQKKSDRVCIFIRWGIMLLNLGNIKQGEGPCDKSLLQKEFAFFEQASQQTADPYVLFMKGMLYLILDRKKEAEGYLTKSQKTILEFLNVLNEEDIKKIVKGRAFYLLLDLQKSIDGAFFQKTIEDKNIFPENLDKYKEAYISSNVIISKLHVKLENEEKLVSHYRRKTTAQKMLFDDESKFRLSAINYSNDPTEGETLLGYLYGEENAPSREVLNSEYGIFAASFSFSYDSLNQFRLYGKEDGEEGVGLSLVFRSSFFSKEANFGVTSSHSVVGRKQRTKSLNKDEKTHKKCHVDGFNNNDIVLDCHYTNDSVATVVEKDCNSSQRLALFRCIYIDPNTRHVITVGQKEEHYFHREGNVIAFKGYKKRMLKSIDDIRGMMNKLKNLVDDDSLDKNIIGQLLIKLRYLTKHVAFKEEQECRIIKICHLNDSEINDGSSYQQMYVNYEPKVLDHIEKVYFGPKTKGIERFRDMLIHKRLNINYERSKNPLT